jgi:uncharacterized membrane protein YdjX (TVP38/TMEM64 family)
LTDRAPGGAGWSRLAAGAALVVGFVLLARYLGLGELLGREGLSRAREWIDGLGALGPIAFITAFVVAVVAFVPALPFTILAGALFGPLWGTGYCSIASVIGASAAFLIARVRHHDELADLVTAQVQKISGIDETNTLIAFRAYSQRSLEAMWDIGNEEALP